MMLVMTRDKHYSIFLNLNQAKHKKPLTMRPVNECIQGGELVLSTICPTSLCTRIDILRLRSVVYKATLSQLMSVLLTAIPNMLAVQGS
jgi:hypothetical protein